jgi:hypothetical protein
LNSATLTTLVPVFIQRRPLPWCVMAVKPAATDVNLTGKNDVVPDRH